MHGGAGPVPGGGSDRACGGQRTLALVIGEGGAERVADGLVEVLEAGPAGDAEARGLAHRRPAAEAEAGRHEVHDAAPEAGRRGWKGQFP